MSWAMWANFILAVALMATGNDRERRPQPVCSPTWQSRCARNDRRSRALRLHSLFP